MVIVRISKIIKINILYNLHNDQLMEIIYSNGSILSFFFLSLLHNVNDILKGSRLNRTYF